MKNPSPHLLSLLHRAQLSPYGIVVAVDSVPKIRNQLSLLKEAARDPTLNNLIFAASPQRPDTELWIIKKTRAAPPQSGDVLPILVKES